VRILFRSRQTSVVISQHELKWVWFNYQ